ncbi:MAG: TolC family protein [Planctomycetota bacterium]|nr:TolC family protein [Planctomycetota bacterium]
MLSPRLNIRILLLLGIVLSLANAGCTRRQWRQRADCDSYSILDDRLAPTPWAPPEFNLAPDQRSRLADWDDPDCSRLPDPQPTLYSYQIPPLESDLGTPPGQESPASPATVPPPPTPGDLDSQLPPDAAAVRVRKQDSLHPKSRTSSSSTDRAQSDKPSKSKNKDIVLVGGQPDASAVEDPDRSLVAPEPTASQVSPAQWNALPLSCQSRMLEFRQLAAEYERSFGQSAGDELSPNGRGLTLENIVELGLLNSRELQTQKETIYKAALSVSLEQFAYLLKFTPFGNGGDILHRNINLDGNYVADLRTTANGEVDQLMVSGGTFVGRLANNVLLTFNGPNGFAADISSQLVFDITQPLIQRDIRFEPLTRAERNLVYAARTYLRFRKTFFVQLATEYYQILRSYRQIAIESQNYFSLSGAHKQALIELEAGLRSRIQTEQIEQNMLAGRSRLITAGVALERLLDRLKFDLGLPIELPMRVDLTELEDVTSRDETAVAAEAVRRTRERLLDERGGKTPQITLLVNAAVVLHQRIAQWQKTRRGAPGAIVFEELDHLGAQLALADARLAVEAQRRGLTEVESAVEPAAVRLIQRRLELLDAQSRQIEQHLAAATLRTADNEAQRELSNRLLKFQANLLALRAKLADTLDSAQLEDLPALEKVSARLQQQGEELLALADRLPGGVELPATEEERQQKLMELVDRVLGPAEALLADESTALTPVAIELDDAMLTGLALRLDLMNRRGELADARRSVKLAADDLRSVLNLQATEVLGTDSFGPYDTKFDSARTELRLSLDLPFNRQQQRNIYRIAQINYQVGRRNVMQQEDSIKLAVRDDLRNLALARNQFQIGIASAALANERVNSTQLELALGFPGVAARDFLEAQDAFRLAVGGVADNHLGYIVNRIQFFLDLELLQLDDNGFWSGVRDEKMQPTPQYTLDPAAGAPYGVLPPYPWYSRELRDLHPE